MISGAEVEPMAEKESCSDEEFIKNLVTRLLPKVQEACVSKTAQVAIMPEMTDPNDMPLGGNIEHQQSSGLAVIEALQDKLKLMCETPIDLQNIDYPCLDRVLSFLERRGEDCSQDSIRLRQLEQNYGSLRKI